MQKNFSAALTKWFHKIHINLCKLITNYLFYTYENSHIPQRMIGSDTKLV